MQHIKNIIFDLGGVIYNIDYGLTEKAFAALGIPAFRSHYSQHLQSDLFDKLETGKIAARTFYQEIRRISGLALTDDDIEKAWNAMLIDLPAIRTDLLAKARSNYRIFLLSNTNVIHISAVMNLLSQDDAYRRFFGLFEKVYFSFEVGMRKPDPAIFQHVLQQNGLQASETLFIDDSRQHVDGALTTGIHAYHMQDLPLEVIMKDGIIQPSLQPLQAIS